MKDSPNARALNALALFLPLAVVALAAAQAAPPDPIGGNAGLPRPAVDERVQALGSALFDAVLHDDPALADAGFFPRDAFLQVKAMRDPGRYWDRLHARFATDIHALHAGLGGLSGARFDHLELVRRGGLVRPGEEGNRLAYWASRHSRLFFRVGAALRSFELRVAISWQDRWYVIHLSEFRHS